MSAYADLAANVTAQLVARIEAGAGDWRMPWHTNPGVLDVRNAATGDRYRGTNTIALALAGLDANWPSGWWATYQQWSDLGAQVRRGATGARIVKWVPGRTDTDEAGIGEDHARRRLVPKVYAVFNAAQVDGWTVSHTTPNSVVERDAAADMWITSTGATISHGHHHAAYLPSPDRIELPDPERFDDRGGYYATALHELCHWTGHPSRLARDLTGRFGDDAYAAEELVAELGAAIASTHLGVTSEPRADHAAYLAHWLRILRADPTALFATAAKAQAAVDHLDAYTTTAVTR